MLGTTKIPVVNLLFGSGVLQRVKGITFDPSTPDRIVMTDEEKLARGDDEDFVFTLHESKEDAEAQKAALEGEKADA